MKYEKRSMDPNVSSTFRPASAPRCDSWFKGVRCQLDDGHGDRSTPHMAAPATPNVDERNWAAISRGPAPIRWNDKGEKQ